MVDYYGSPTPLNQLAGVSVSGSQSLTVSPYDKSAFKLIETAILESGLGLNPNNEGRYVCRYVMFSRAFLSSHLHLVIERDIF